MQSIEFHGEDALRSIISAEYDGGVAAFLAEVGA